VINVEKDTDFVGCAIGIEPDGVFEGFATAECGEFWAARGKFRACQPSGNG
jgi:hypothetical protein